MNEDPHAPVTPESPELPAAVPRFGEKSREQFAPGEVPDPPITFATTTAPAAPSDVEPRRSLSSAPSDPPPSSALLRDFEGESPTSLVHDDEFLDRSSPAVSRGGWFLATAAGVLVLGAVVFGLSTLQAGGAFSSAPVDVAVESLTSGRDAAATPAPSISRSTPGDHIVWTSFDRPEFPAVVDFPAAPQRVERRNALTGITEVREQAAGPAGSTLLFSTQPLGTLTSDPSMVAQIAEAEFDGQSGTSISAPVATPDGQYVDFEATVGKDHLNGRVLLVGGQAVVMAVLAPEGASRDPAVAAALGRVIDSVAPRAP